MCPCLSLYSSFKLIPIQNLLIEVNNALHGFGSWFVLLFQIKDRSNFFFKIIIVSVYVPLNARHCAEYPQLAKSSLWARSVHSTMESLEQGRGGEGQGTWTPNQK